MALRMAATASAWASVFSPVSSVSPAMKGSAKARARASAFDLVRHRLLGGGDQFGNRCGISLFRCQAFHGRYRV